MIPILALIIALVLVSIIRATRHQLSFEKCSATDFTLLGVFALFAAILTVVASLKIKLQDRENSDTELTSVSNGDEWSNSSIFQLLLTSLIGGVLAGVIGNGGAVVFAPLLAGFKEKSNTVWLTTKSLVFLSTLTSTLLLVSEGMLMYNFAMW